MRIHNHIRDNARFRAGHVMGPQARTNRALLAMAIGVSCPIGRRLSFATHKKNVLRNSQAIHLISFLIGRMMDNIGNKKQLSILTNKIMW